MMNLTTKTSKTFLLFKRSLILLCFVSYALVVKADIGDHWYAQYRVKVSLTNRSTGSGTVYMKADNTNGNSETVTLPDKNNTQITVRSDRKRVSSNSTSYTHTFNNITLVAEAMPGSEFVGWEETNLSGNSAVIATSQYYNLQEYEFLIREGFRILDEFGNHPSFILFSMGNELWGNRDFQRSRFEELGSDG